MPSICSSQCQVPCSISRDSCVDLHLMDPGVFQLPGWTLPLWVVVVCRLPVALPTVSLMLYCNAKVMSCSASTGIVTLASDFPSNQLQAGDLGIQNTVNIPTDISSSTHCPPVHWLFQCRYAPHKDLCSGCHGLELHTAVALSVWLC